MQFRILNPNEKVKAEIVGHYYVKGMDIDRRKNPGLAEYNVV